MHVRVNVAATADGKLATRTREQLRISGPADLARVHRLRAAYDGILVGVGTVLADDPHLIVDSDRLDNGTDSTGPIVRSRLDPTESGPPATPTVDAIESERGATVHPTRVVVDSTGRTPTDARVLDDAAPTVILASERLPANRRAALEGAGATVVAVGADRVDLAAGFEALASRGIDSLLVEGGGELIFSLFAAALVDELSVYVGGMVAGGAEAPTIADGEGFRESLPELTFVDASPVDEGVLLRWRVPGR